MNGISKTFLGLAASVVVSGAVFAQDNSALVRQARQTNSITAIVAARKAVPQLAVGPHVQATGLVVDLMQPQQTLDLFNPANLPPVALKSDLAVPPPMVVPEPLSGPEFHGPNFAVLRLSFK